MMLPIYDKVLQKSHSMKYKRLKRCLVILARPKPLFKAASHRTDCVGSCSIQFWYLPEKKICIIIKWVFSFSLRKSTNTNKLLLKIKYVLTSEHQENLYCTFIIINVYKYWMVLTKGTKRHHMFMWMKGNIAKWRCEGQVRIYGYLISCRSEMSLLMPWKNIWNIWYSKITVG